MQEKESRKTLTFVIVAAMAVLVAWEPWRPAPPSQSPQVQQGAKLFPEFTDPLKAKSLEIVNYDEANAAIRDFRVAQINGVWSIPSHNNYPADAAQHMADAATALVDLDILGLASDLPGDQELYGVITPDPAKLKPGMTGVGRRVTIKDGKDKVLADLVIGKQVKDQPGQHYVRDAGRDQIYRVNVKTDKLSTKFEDWIEKDLLKLNAFDVREVALNDYSTQAGVTPDGNRAISVNERSRTKLGYDDTKSSWNLIELTEYDEEHKPVQVTLAEDEELNTEKLNGLKTALDDLQIVDVERKPKGLSQDLRASDEFVKNAEAFQSLVERGFVPASRPGGDLEIFSSEGEVVCATKDGVRYVLRFGNLAGGSVPESQDEEGKEGEKKSNPALNRYLFVMAQFDESQLPKPELEPLPGEEPKAEEQPAEEKPAEQPAEEKPAEESPTEEKPADNAAEEKPAEEQPSADVPEQKTADAGAQDEPAADKPADTKPADTKPAEAAPADAAKQPEAVPGTPEDEKRIAIQKENKRKQDEYDAAVKKGQERVQELNERFADWYFIISDDVYKKIHLGRGDIIRKKEAQDAAGAQGGTQELNNLKGGLPSFGN